jgi:hypothetical protein
MKNNLKIFEEKKVRSVWSEEKQKWFFSVIDIVAILTNQDDYKKAKSYWSTLKERLVKEGSQLVTNCDQLKMMSADGKFYKTDVADTETIFRLTKYC